MSFVKIFAIIVYGFFALVIISTIVYYFRFQKVNQIRKRLSKNESLKEKEDNNLFDFLINKYNRFIKLCNNILSKSVLLTNYSNYYKKYINKDDKDSSPMTFISIKVLFGFFVLALMILTMATEGETITLLSIIIGYTAGFFIPDLFLLGRSKLVKKDMENEMMKAVTIMNNSFKVGYSIMQTIDITENELNGNLKDEFTKMSKDLHYGLDIETVFKRFSNRVKMSIATYMATSLTILNKTGGNIIKVFSSMERTIFDNRKLEEELKNLSAPAKFLYRVLVFVPIIFILLIYILDPTYFNPLFSHPLGIIIVLLILVIYIVYIIVVKKIIKLKEY